MFNIYPCPDCWGEGNLTMNWHNDCCYIKCEDCGAYTVDYPEESSAISDWNSGHVISRLSANQEKTRTIEPEIEGYEETIGYGKKK